jgi:hypothetical protein
MSSCPENVIAIHGAPRSGTSWIGQIINSHPKVAFRFQPLFSYVFKDRLNEKSTTQEITTFFEDIYKTDDDFILQRENIKKGNYPQFKKDANPTHMVYKEVRYHHILYNLFEKYPKIKVVGIVRHPCSVINSQLMSPAEFKPEWRGREMEEWRFSQIKNSNKPEEFNGFEKWKEVTSLFLEFSKIFPDNFYLIKYSDFLANVLESTKNLFTFCRLDINQQTINFINESQEQTVDHHFSVYRKNFRDDKWKEQLNPKIVQEILNDLKGTQYESFLV